MSNHNSKVHDANVIWLAIYYFLTFICLALLIYIIITLIIDCLTKKKDRVGTEDGEIYVYTEYVPNSDHHYQIINNEMNKIPSSYLYYQTNVNPPYDCYPPSRRYRYYSSRNYYGTRNYYGLPPPRGHPRYSNVAPLDRSQRPNSYPHYYESEVGEAPLSIPRENNSNNDNFNNNNENIVENNVDNINNNNLNPDHISVSNVNLYSNNNTTNPINNSNTNGQNPYY